MFTTRGTANISDKTHAKEMLAIPPIEITDIDTETENHLRKMLSEQMDSILIDPKMAPSTGVPHRLTGC